MFTKVFQYSTSDHIIGTDGSNRGVAPEQRRRVDYGQGRMVSPLQGSLVLSLFKRIPGYGFSEYRIIKNID